MLKLFSRLNSILSVTSQKLAITYVRFNTCKRAFPAFPYLKQEFLFRDLKTSVTVRKDMEFEEDKNKYLKMNLKEKRATYHCTTSFVTLENIPTWTDYSAKVKKVQSSSELKKDEGLNNKVSIFVGDITALEIDAIVNAANNSLRGGGGVDGAIHRAAGKSLLTECITLNGCPTGEAKITGGYKLPAKYVIHTVGPVGEKPDLLKNCYSNSLNLAKENGLKTIAFPCISTGVYGYPNKNAAEVALRTVREFLEKNGASIDRVIFCLFLPVDVEIYDSLMQKYFPL